MDREIVVIAHNVRSSHNVGSLFRTCEGLGVEKLYLTGYTPYPDVENDSRLPHIAKKVNGQIQKTALGTEKILAWKHNYNVIEVIVQLKKNDFIVVGLEQSPSSETLNKFNPPNKLAVVLGNEVNGLESDVINACSKVVEIPMLGKKESFNVTQAAAMALYAFRYMS